LYAIAFGTKRMLAGRRLRSGSDPKTDVPNHHV
jgi:hypothetical protein